MSRTKTLLCLLAQTEFVKGSKRWVQHPQQELAAAWSKKVD